MKRPDWAQRMVEVEGYLETGASAWIPKDVAAALLRAHHRKVKRMVRKLLAYWSPCSYSQYEAGHEDALNAILAKLKELER